MPRTETREQIYGEVNSVQDIRTINEKIRGQMERAGEREDLTELKKRSDYLCALAMAPSWKKKFGGKADSILRAAKEENKKSTELANRLADRHGWDADYDPWG